MFPYISSKLNTVLSFEATSVAVRPRTIETCIQGYPHHGNSLDDFQGHYFQFTLPDRWLWYGKIGEGKVSAPLSALIF